VLPIFLLQLVPAPHDVCRGLGFRRWRKHGANVRAIFRPDLDVYRLLPKKSESILRSRLQ